MKFLILFTFLVAGAAFADAYAWFDGPNKEKICDENNSCADYCRIKTTGEDVLLKPNETILNDQCEEIKCYNDFSSSLTGCGVASYEGCSRMEHDYSKKYPECCNKICIK